LSTYEVWAKRCDSCSDI